MAQDSTSVVKNSSEDTIKTKKDDYRITYKQLIIPSICITYGIAGLYNKHLKELNFSTRNEVVEDRPETTQFDNYTQYFPAAMVYGLNAFGLKGKHNLVDATIIYASSQLISSAFVIPIKHLVKEERPDKTDDLSFPSGHTTTAFSSAQFLFMEYKDTNLWVSLSGYPFAIFTGMYRVINNKHYVGDVAAGAGIGILSTEMAYWLYPKIRPLFYKKKKKESGQSMLMPTYQSGNWGVSLVQTF
jgi:hypothetical protein